MGKTAVFDYLTTIINGQVCILGLKMTVSEETEHKLSAYSYKCKQMTQELYFHTILQSKGCCLKKSYVFHGQNEHF